MNVGGGHTGPITQEARVVLVTRSGSGHLLALPCGVLGGCVLFATGVVIKCPRGTASAKPSSKGLKMFYNNGSEPMQK